MDSGNSHQITSDNSGRYVFAIWIDGSGDIQTARSADFSQTWSLTTRFDTGSSPQITSDNSGRYAFAIWIDGTTKIQTARSDDFSQSWSFTKNFGSGLTPQMATDSSGRHVFPIWRNSFIFTSQGLRTFFPLINVGISRN